MRRNERDDVHEQPKTSAQNFDYVPIIPNISNCDHVANSVELIVFQDKPGVLHVVEIGFRWWRLWRGRYCRNCDSGEGFIVRIWPLYDCENKRTIFPVNESSARKISSLASCAKELKQPGRIISALKKKQTLLRGGRRHGSGDPCTTDLASLHQSCRVFFVFFAKRGIRDSAGRPETLTWPPTFDASRA